MDWRSEEGRALLRRAYPAGFLAARGVTTVGGWTCVRVRNEDETVVGLVGLAAWMLYAEGYGFLGPCFTAIHRGDYIGVAGASVEDGMVQDRIHAAFLAGDLLPLPDPADPATWACLLADLGGHGDDPGIGYAWSSNSPSYVQSSVRSTKKQWYLRCFTQRRERLFCFAIEESDPAVALIQARAHLRAREGR